MSEMGYIVRCAILQCPKSSSRPYPNTKYFALTGIGINIRYNSVFGNSIPNASKIPNIAPEAPIIGTIYFQFYDLTEELFPCYNVLLRTGLLVQLSTTSHTHWAGWPS